MRGENSTQGHMFTDLSPSASAALRVDRGTC